MPKITIIGPQDGDSFEGYLFRFHPEKKDRETYDPFELFGSNLKSFVVDVLKLQSPDDVSLFVIETAAPSSQKHIIVEVDLLSHMPERTYEVRKKLLEGIIDQLFKAFPGYHLFEGVIKAFAGQPEMAVMKKRN